MVQQAYAAAGVVAANATSEWPQPQLQVVANGIQTLAASASAMPAVVAAAAAAQYSPQDSNSSGGGGQNSNSLYQQQLIKSAQQQFAVQHQHQQHQHQRMNGISTGDGLYNGVSAAIARPAPIYAPKPTYYSQQQQPVYQQTRAFYTPQQQQQQHQQQHSPASLLQQQQQPASQLAAAVGLSVRQLPATNMLSNHQQQQNSPQSTNHHLHQQAVQSSTAASNQQMQHLIMSYQQQQQQQPFINQIQAQPNYTQTNYNAAASIMPSSLNDNLQQQQQEASRRSQIEEQHRLIQQQHLRHSARAAARFSDRDSQSTMSRFNQFTTGGAGGGGDDRRSFTMRSQYTSAANNAAKYSRQFGFLELTGEALKRTLGLSATATARYHDNNKLLSPAAAIVGDDRKQNSSTGAGGNLSAKITSIDSGEDYYFKRKVFKYQLVILRLVTFLCAAFVLLSPVAMLLIPKLESFLGNSNQAADSSPTSSASETTASVVTHGVGLSKQHHQYQFVPQPQWRISECTSDCDGPLIGFFARFIMLCIAYWAIFFRSQTSSLPRIDFHRCLLISVAVLLTLAYWLFFIFRLFDKRYQDFELQYMTIVQFALSMLESLILLHYLAVVLLELSSRRKVYCLKVVRSPDGASQYLSCGSLSIQKCAQFVLEKYHREFKNFTPYHEHLLELEDEFAKNHFSPEPAAAGAIRDNGSRRSRPSSPANSQARSGSRHHQQSTSSRPSRHHSRSQQQHRSPSRSPTAIRSASRSRSQRKSTAADDVAGAAQQQLAKVDQQNGGNSQVKLYQVDLNPPTTENASSAPAKTATSSSNNNSQESVDDSKVSGNENDSADQSSSDATSRMKESSLETIRAANSTSELLTSSSQQQQSAAKSSAAAASASSAKHQQQQRGSGPSRAASRHDQEQSQRDETESVRSVRSRRSTSRSHRHHHHHQHHHRERSSSRRNDEQQQHHHHQSSRDEVASTDRRRGSSMANNNPAATVSIPMNKAADDRHPLEEHERKLRRRKYRLLQSVQDSFEQIRQIDEAQNGHQQQMDGSSTSLQQQQQQPSPALSPNQAARSLYPSMARSLQKYLRLTKQTGRHNLQSIYEHLAKCLLYRLSPRAFLEKFLNQDPVWQQNETNLFARCRLQTGDSAVLMNNSFGEDLELNSWSLVCDTLLSRQIGSGTFFVLKQGQVSLLVTVAKLPHLNLTEEVIDQKSCKFSLAPNSETSV